MKINLLPFGFVILLAGHSVFAQRTNFKESDLRSEENITWPVRSIRFESATFVRRNRKLIELPRQLDRISNFNSSRNRMQDLEFYGGELTGRKIYTENRDEQRSEEEEYRPDGTLFRRTVYVPYSLPNSVVTQSYDHDGILQEDKFIFIYGTNGKIIKLIQDNGKSAVVMPYPVWIIYRYHRKTRRTDLIYCSGNADSRDKDMGLSDAAKPCGGAELSGINYSFYDTRGNEIREEANTINYHLKHTYKFDSKGNWTKRFTFIKHIRGGKAYYDLDNVTYRTITYY